MRYPLSFYNSRDTDRCHYFQISYNNAFETFLEIEPWVWKPKVRFLRVFQYPNDEYDLPMRSVSNAQFVQCLTFPMSSFTNNVQFNQIPVSSMPNFANGQFCQWPVLPVQLQILPMACFTSEHICSWKFLLTLVYTCTASWFWIRNICILIKPRDDFERPSLNQLKQHILYHSAI